MTKNVKNWVDFLVNPIFFRSFAPKVIIMWHIGRTPHVLTNEDREKYKVKLKEWSK